MDKLEKQLAAVSADPAFKPLETESNWDSILLDPIPPRDWIIKDYLLRGYVSALFSPGAVGKSTFALVEAISVATGKDLLGLGVQYQAPVLLINNEDDIRELKRRIKAILQFYNIDPRSITDNLHVLSGYDRPVSVAIEKDGDVIAAPDVGRISEYVDLHDIGLVSIDPFVSTHNSNENGNDVIDKVVQQYKSIAKQKQAAVRLIHHTRKQGPDSEKHAGDSEAGRGASALKDAARVSHTLARMSTDSSKKEGIPLVESRRLIRLDSAKMNFSLPDSQATWFRMWTVDVDGEETGVPKRIDLELIPRESKGVPKVSTPVCVIRAALRKGIQTGEVLWSDIRGDFMEFSGFGRSKSNDQIKTLGKGMRHAKPYEVDGAKYKVWHTQAPSRTAPIFVHIEEVK